MPAWSFEWTTDNPRREKREPVYTDALNFYTGKPAVVKHPKKRPNVVIAAGSSNVTDAAGQERIHHGLSCLVYSRRRMSVPNVIGLKRECFTRVNNRGL
jgi:hypothetical protein